MKYLQLGETYKVTLKRLVELEGAQILDRPLIFHPQYVAQRSDLKVLRWHLNSSCDSYGYGKVSETGEGNTLRGIPEPICNICLNFEIMHICKDRVQLEALLQCEKELKETPLPGPTRTSGEIAWDLQNRAKTHTRLTQLIEPGQVYREAASRLLEDCVKLEKELETALIARKDRLLLETALELIKPFKGTSRETLISMERTFGNTGVMFRWWKEERATKTRALTPSETRALARHARLEDLDQLNFPLPKSIELEGGETLKDLAKRLWERERDNAMEEHAQKWEQELTRIRENNSILYLGAVNTPTVVSSLPGKVIKASTIRMQGTARVIEVPKYCAAYLDNRCRIPLQKSGACTRELALDAGVLWEPDHPEGAYTEFKDAVKAARRLLKK
jgi:hypothetical protein